jgi:hypothetical protein
VVGDAATVLQTMGQIPGMTEDDIAPLANAALRALDGPSLTAMKPDQAASLAGIAVNTSRATWPPRLTTYLPLHRRWPATPLGAPCS